MADTMFIEFTDLEPVLAREGLIELTDDEGIGSSDISIIEDAIKRASDYMLGYVRDILPDNFIPDNQFKGVCADLAVWLLYRRNQDNSVKNEAIIALQHDAVKYLMDIKNGVITLDGMADTSKSIRISKAERVFEADDLKER